VNGGTGNDSITGGFGRDVIAVGGGDDLFVYLSQREAGDGIADFGASGDDDAFALKAAAFGNHAAGGLLAGKFQSSNAGTASRPAVCIFFGRDDHSLYFDADGSGTQAAILITVLQPGAVVVAADISFF